MAVGSLFFALASLVLLWSVYSVVSILTHTRTYTGQFLYPELYSGISGTSTDATLCISGLRHFSHLIVGSCVSLDTTTVPLPSPQKFFLMSPIGLCHRHLSPSSPGQCGKTWITTASLIVTLPAVAILW